MKPTKTVLLMACMFMLAAPATAGPVWLAQVGGEAPAAAAPAVPCPNCGTVDSVRVIEKKGEGSGLGAIGGAVVGGLLGSQVGQGRGSTAATIVGAGAGAYAGHQVEKSAKSTQTWEVLVRMEDGQLRTFSYATEPAYRAGDRVKVVDGGLVRN